MTSCYRKSNSTVITDTSYVDSPCSPITTTSQYSSCCPNLNDGGASLCLSDYLCFWSEIHYSGSTGFIAASCTDETYASGQCTEHCTDRPVPDVIYNSDTGLWACCGWDPITASTDCQNPTDETWPAPPPASLLAAASIHSSITGTATSSTTSSTSTSSSSSSSASSTVTSRITSSPTSTPSSSSSSSSSNHAGGLSTGATAGIAIGVILGVLALALAFYFTWRHGRNSRQKYGGNFEDSRPPQTYQQQDTGKSWSGSQPTKYGDYYAQQPVEMHSRSTGELPANSSRQQYGSGNLVELQ